MSRFPFLFATAWTAAACQAYEPEPIDLVEHAKVLASRLPEADSVTRFVAEFRKKAPLAPRYDPGDGIDLAEARLLALLFNPELRVIRLQAGVALANRDHAARWEDPELRADFAHILEDVTNPWVVAAEIGITLPITGRLGLVQELADEKLRLAWSLARAAEARVLAELDVRFLEWSAARAQQRLMNDLLERLRQVEGIATRLATADEITHLDARAFTLERLSRESDLLRQQALVADLERELGQLIGLSPSATPRFEPKLEVEQRFATAADRAEHAQRGPRLVPATP